MRNLTYKEGEKEAMKKSGFPLCFSNTHCNTCIKTYRLYLQQKEETKKFTEGFSYRKPKN